VQLPAMSHTFNHSTEGQAYPGPTDWPPPYVLSTS
jgi:hypothetical protein